MRNFFSHHKIRLLITSLLIFSLALNWFYDFGSRFPYYVSYVVVLGLILNFHIPNDHQLDRIKGNKPRYFLVFSLVLLATMALYLSWFPLLVFAFLVNILLMYFFPLKREKAKQFN